MSYRIFIYLVLIISFLGCSSGKPLATQTSSPLERWIQQQNKEYVRLIKKEPNEFKTLGIGVQNSYGASLEDAKFNSTVLMPEKIGMIIQTIMVSDNGDYEVSHQSGSTIRVDNVKHEEIGKFTYQGKVYVSVVSSKDKAEYFNEFDALSTVARVQSNALEHVEGKVLNHSTSGTKQDTYLKNQEVMQWTESCDDDYKKWCAKNQDYLSSNAWAYDADPQMAYDKAKLIAGSMLPEKVEVYVEVVTQTLTKMGYSQQEITQTRINSLSKSKLNITNLQTDKLAQFKYDGQYFVSVIASKPKKEFDDLIKSSVKTDTKLSNDFFERAGNALTGYY